jgi:hypothetical protein
MANAATALGSRFEPTSRTALLIAGDVAAIGLFVVLGEISHGVDPVAQAGRVADTIAPFLVGWLVVAVAGGLYTADAVRSWRRAVEMTAPAWIAAALIGQGLRATPLFHGDAALPFVVVSILVGLALLVPWRIAVALFTPAARA